MLIFFHGLGLSHMDLEELDVNGTATRDWILEAGMVVATHLLYPGSEQECIWFEDVALVKNDGAEPFFAWGVVHLQEAETFYLPGFAKL